MNGFLAAALMLGGLAVIAAVWGILIERQLFVVRRDSVRVLPAGGPAVAGKLRMVAPTVDPATRNGLVYVDLPGAPAGAAASAAKAGMFARGDFVLGGGSGQTLPQAAVARLAASARSRAAIRSCSRRWRSEMSREIFR